MFLEEKKQVFCFDIEERSEFYCKISLLDFIMVRLQATWQRFPTLEVNGSPLINIICGKPNFCTYGKTRVVLIVHYGSQQRK